MFDKKRKLNVASEIKGEIFLSNQIDLRFYPDLFKLEFKQVNEQVDRVGPERNASIVINHRSIALTPLMMKQFVNIVNNVLSGYEKKYGEIKLPKITKQRTASKKVIDSTGYIG